IKSMCEKDAYTQPLLTKHEPLLNLTGKSAEKIAFADKDPNEKQDEGKNPNEKDPSESGL
ncbi:MAG: hypothetical protein ACM3PP_02360, partial [Candidatus Saccharibacteria bacterium]